MICFEEPEKENRDYKQIQTNHLMALCEIGDDYKSFCEDLEKLVKTKKRKNLVTKAYRIISGNFLFCFKKYRDFINKHKNTLEIMNKYSCLSNETVLSYDGYGKRRENLSADYFYNYIEDHKEDYEKIKEVIIKIKDLGIDRIILDSELDFTKTEYKLTDS